MLQMSRRQWLGTVGSLAGSTWLGAHSFGQEPTRLPPPPEPTNPEEDPLLEKVERAIAITSRRQLTVGQFSPWQVVHGILALRQDLMLKQPGGAEISGIDWMASGAKWKGEPLFEVTPFGGRGHPFTRAYDFEGHPTQFMGYMCEADLPLDFEFQAGSKKITIADIINDAKMQISEGPEVTWTLWALAHYLEPTATWTNSRGESWGIERMLEIQYRESVIGGACGGCHGLYALAYARNKYLAKGNSLRGVWVQADQKIKRYVYEAQALQNTDGSFSAAYFRGAELGRDFAKRLPANGHILEYLMVALSEKDLKQPWVRRGVDSVAQDLIDNRRTECDCGPLFHALHALKMYNFRVNPKAKSYSTRPRPLGRSELVRKPEDDDRQPPVIISQEPAAPRG